MILYVIIILVVAVRIGGVRHFCLSARDCWLRFKMVRTHGATQNETKKMPACHDSASLINYFRQPHNYTSFKTRYV